MEQLHSGIQAAFDGIFKLAYPKHFLGLLADLS